jgi:hypothetical protein
MAAALRIPDDADQRSGLMLAAKGAQMGL